MKTQRYNVFNVAHKSFRTMMFNTALKMQTTDLIGDALSLTIVEQLVQLLEAGELYAGREDHFINGPLESTDPKMSNLFQRDHQLNHRLSIVIKNLLMDCYDVSNDLTRNCLVIRLNYALNEYIAFNLDHMNKEEIELNRILWKNYSDDELREIEQNLLNLNEREYETVRTSTGLL